MYRFRLALLTLLLAGISIRLVDITLPLIDHHSFRQCDTAAIARNFYEGRFNILYPRVDWGGDTKGYIECEFPLYNFLIAVLYRIFGQTDTLARLVSVIFFAGTFIYLYLLTKILYNKKTAFWACFVLVFLPESVYFTRTVMPESAMLFFSIGTMYYLFRWTETGYFKNFILSMVFFSIAMLVKLPTLCLFLPIAYCIYKKYKFKGFFKLQICSSILCAFAPVALWYFHAHYNLGKVSGLTFGMWNYWSRLADVSILQNMKFYKEIYDRLCGIVMTDVGFWLFILGLLFGIIHSKQNLLRVWVIAIFLYFIIAAKDNYRHDYYQLPIVLPASILIGAVFGFLFKKNRIEINGKPLGKNFTIILSSICIFFFLSLCWENLGDLAKRRFWNLYYSGQSADKIIPRDSLIITCSDGVHFPEILYYAHRKGWHVLIDEKPDYILGLIDRGARYIVLAADDELSGKLINLEYTPLYKFMMDTYKVIYKTDSYIIFQCF